MYKEPDPRVRKTILVLAISLPPCDRGVRLGWVFLFYMLFGGPELPHLQQCDINEVVIL